MRHCKLFHFECSLLHAKAKSDTIGLWYHGTPKKSLYNINDNVFHTYLMRKFQNIVRNGCVSAR